MTNYYSKLDQLHATAKQNQWMGYFAIFNRVVLAIGFIIAGWIKIVGQRFASGLSVNHPMGHYLEALYHTGYYYPFIGIVQVLAAILLLVPRTATLGAIMYFPVILNICILSHAVRFEGSLASSSLMVLSNVYLLCWDYDKLKYILPFYRPALNTSTPVSTPPSNKFPIKFFAGVFVAVVVVVVAAGHMYNMVPRNSLHDCLRRCQNSDDPGACAIFCSGIHQKGEPLDKALDEYEQAVKNDQHKK